MAMEENVTDIISDAGLRRARAMHYDVHMRDVYISEAVSK